MTSQQDLFTRSEYQYGFVTAIEMDTVAPGLSEETIRFISAKKAEPEWLLQWRLKAYARFLQMQEPVWAKVHYPKIDLQSVVYYAAPKSQQDGPKSLDDVDPELLKTYDKLGIPLHERARLAGVAVDAVFDSVSVATTFKSKLAEAGVIFCSFSEAVREHPALVQQYLGVRKSKPFALGSSRQNNCRHGSGKPNTNRRNRALYVLHRIINCKSCCN